MLKQSEDPLVEISSSTLAIGNLVASFKEDCELHDSLQEANVLIVPTDLSPEYDGPAFPEGTRDVFNYLQEELGDRAHVEATIRDDDYVEFAYRSEEIILPALHVALAISLPLVINLLSSYLYERLSDGLWHRGKVRSEIHIKGKDGSQRMLKYHGPADTFERVVIECLREHELLSKEKD